MTRKNFVRLCGIMGIGLPLQASLTSCSKEDDLQPDTTEKIIIIGAGAAGLTSAYLLNQLGIDVRVLEATSNYGGRMKRTLDFADFPISLGAEWLHVERGIFDEIVNDSSVQIDINTSPYNPDVDYGIYNDGSEASFEDLGVEEDQKFIDASWFDFFEQYVLPSIEEKISYNVPVESVDYSGDELIVKTANDEFKADKVIVSVPLKILQKGAINFTPELPSDKQDAISNLNVWDGCKAFIEFSESFYPAFTEFVILPESAGQKLYYDAAYGQNTTQNILGLFAVGTGTVPYVNLSDEELRDYMLSELDDIFDDQASPNYVRHMFQNWNDEPFINAAYVSDHEDWSKIRDLGKSVDDKLYFAGDAYTEGNDWGSVHAAARSAKRAVQELVG